MKRQGPSLSAGPAARSARPSETRNLGAAPEWSEANRREALRRRVLGRRGLFISFEGIEGSGKSLQIKRLARFLRGESVSVIATKEPGGTPAGAAIRRLFLGPRGAGLDPWTELFLMEAARAQHLAGIVRPALLSGTTVLCDRYTDSTIAYQGYGRGLPLEVIQHLHGLPGLRPAPDLTLIFDLPVAEGLARAKGRNARFARRRREGRIDAEREVFHAKVRRGYLAIAAREPVRTVIVPASASPETVERKVRQIVLSRMGLEWPAGPRRR